MHTPGALDISTLTRYSLKDCSLKADAQGDFVSFAALQHEIDIGEGEREALAFMRSVPRPPSVRAKGG